MSLQDIIYTHNAYKSSTADAKDFVTGRRVAGVKIEEQRLRDLLWQHRDEIDALIREKLGDTCSFSMR